jgi:hypothetical protein
MRKRYAAAALSLRTHRFFTEANEYKTDEVSPCSGKTQQRDVDAPLPRIERDTGRVFNA